MSKQNDITTSVTGRDMPRGQHTPGPWGAVIGQDDDGLCTVGPQHGGIAVVDTIATVRGVYNALVIAAAPELLEALQWMVEEADMQAEKFTGSYEYLDSARAAIAKATGGAA